jgi:hypothetical protein
MADTKISAMPAAATLDGTEITPIVQSGVNKQVTTASYVSQVLDVNPVLVTQGGTGAITAAGARTNLAAAHSAITLTAGTGLSGGGNLTANRSFAIANTGVVATTYGSATKIPVLAINAQGQITSASEQTLSAASINLAYGAFLQNGETTLTDAITNNSTTPIVVGDTTQFGSAGYIIIENEVIQYTGKTATSFTGITRGVKGTTNVAHDAGVAVSEAAAIASSSASSVIGYDTTIYSNNISIVSTSRVTFANAGLYNIQFSLQLLNFTTSEDNVTVWLRLNGVDVAQSASIEQVNSKHGTSPGARILALNLFQQVTAGQYIELAWASNTGNTVIASFPSGVSPVHPVSPAVILTALQVA